MSVTEQSSIPFPQPPSDYILLYMRERAVQECSRCGLFIFKFQCRLSDCRAGAHALNSIVPASG